MRFMMLMIPGGYEEAGPDAVKELDPEAKEVVGGYWIIEVDSREEAVAWAKRCPGSENEVIEVRRIQEMSDYSGEVQEIIERSGGAA